MLSTVSSEEGANFHMLVHVFDNHCPAALVHDSTYNFVVVECENVRLNYLQ